MVRFSKYSFILLFILFFFPSCQNEGDIGDLYGQWRLSQSSVDDLVKQHVQIYFSFQGKVVWAKRVDIQENAYGDVFGSFVHQGDSLILSFSQQNEYTTPESLIRNECRFVDPENIRLKVVTLNESGLKVMSGDNYWQFEKY